MFTNVMIGSLPRVGDPDSSTSEPNDRNFFAAAAQAMRISSAMTYSVKESILNNVLNLKTKQCKEFESNCDLAQQIAQPITKDLYRRRAINQLSELEQDSYANLALTGQENPKTNDQNDRDMYVAFARSQSRHGSIDIRWRRYDGGMLSLKLLHIASSPEL